MSKAESQRGSSSASSLSVLARAVFLACSWTWCIGMWLPVYLCAEFGWPGWVAFIVPNCIGAAAVGVIIRSREHSERLEARHPQAFRWFSIVTIAFHAFFLAAMFTWVFEDFTSVRLVGPVAAMVVLVAGYIATRMSTRGFLISAVCVFLASAGTVVGIALTAPRGALSVPTVTGPGGLPGLAAAFPVIAIGFLLCPLLDLTFHRVRRDLPGRAGGWVFIIGFAVFFPPLVTYTLYYAGGVLRGIVSLYLMLHLAAQAWFTVAAHMRELRERGGASDVTAKGRSLGFMSGLFVFAVALGEIAARGGQFSEGYTFVRLGYELFMSMYGLTFPAYVWIVMIERGTPMRVRVVAWLAACAIAAPMYWVGYIMQHYVWLLPGVGVVLVAPLVMRWWGRSKG